MSRGDGDHGVAVVGAGAVGVTTAYDLARAGVDGAECVKIWERMAVEG